MLRRRPGRSVTDKPLFLVNGMFLEPTGDGMVQVTMPDGVVMRFFPDDAIHLGKKILSAVTDAEFLKIVGGE